MQVAPRLVAARLVHLDARQRGDASPTTNQDMDPIVSPALKPIQVERGTGTQRCFRPAVSRVAQRRCNPVNGPLGRMITSAHTWPTSSEQLCTNLVLCHADGGELVATHDVG